MTTDPSDIVERLLDVADLDARAGEPLGKACREAAAEITRLREALAEMKERCAKVVEEEFGKPYALKTSTGAMMFRAVTDKIATTIRGLE